MGHGRAPRHLTRPLFSSSRAKDRAAVRRPGTQGPRAVRPPLGPGSPLRCGRDDDGEESALLVFITTKSYRPGDQITAVAPGARVRLVASAASLRLLTRSTRSPAALGRSTTTALVPAFMAIR
ncbi:hypothetical protein DMC25_07030 [Caulobacter sp. D4A]|nr:hypothetical protein DMC25_07030 [Caulobacter sp. D4A]PXA95565.1 hypothetical protein DMC18_03690 [Caulobacter sp. D5]